MSSMRLARPLRVLFIGYGAMVRNHHEHVIADFGEVVGVCRRSTADGPPHIPVFGSVAEGLATGPDLVVVSTPHSLHFEQVWQCLDAGCHVLVEKPMALDVAQVEELVTLAERKGRLLVEGLQRRYEGLACSFRRLKVDVALGEVQFVHGLFAHRFADTEGWRADPRQAGLGIIDDSAIHLVDLLMYFAGGEPISMHCELGTDDSGLPTTFATSFSTDSGVIVSACGSYLSPVRSVQEEISIFGSEGSLFARRFRIEHDVLPPEIVFKSAGGEIVERIDAMALPIGRTLPLRAVLAALVGSGPRSDIHSEGRNVVGTHRLLQAMRRKVVAED